MSWSLATATSAFPAHYLRSIVGALAQPGVGAVTCCYTGRASARFWSRMSAMGIDYHFLPAVLYGVGIGLATPCFGSTIAVRKSVLAEIGGFAAFGERLADDYEIGRAIRARGYRIALPSFVVTHSSNEDSAGDLFRHELRWARTIRAIDGLGHMGSLITHPVPLAILGALLLGFSYHCGSGAYSRACGPALVEASDRPRSGHQRPIVLASCAARCAILYCVHKLFFYSAGRLARAPLQSPRPRHAGARLRI